MVFLRELNVREMFCVRVGSGSQQVVAGWVSGRPAGKYTLSSASEVKQVSWSYLLPYATDQYNIFKPNLTLRLFKRAEAIVDPYAASQNTV